EFWELASFIANTLIFIMVGVVIAEKVVFTPYDFLLLGIIYVGMFIARAGVVSLFFPSMKRLGYGVKKAEAYVLWWGGLRGAIGLALALMVAGESAIDPPIRNTFLFLTAGIVMLTLLVNATTVKPLVKSLGLTKIPPTKALMMYNARSYLRTSAENNLERLKEDRFLSRANWQVVEEYLPTPPKEEEGNQELDYLAETRRRILQKEKSSYWSQFKEGMLTPSAVQRLNDAINEVLDQGGNVPLSQRKDLEELWRTPKFLSKSQNYPVIGRMAERFFFDQLAQSYDTARGFVVAQEDALKLVESMHRGSDDQVDPEERESALSTVESEINENRIHGLTFLRNLRKRYPEIYTSIATREAARSLLNYERRTVERLRNKGRLEADEVEKMDETIEERMKRLMNDPPKTQLPQNEELLKDVPFLKELDPRGFQKLADLFRSQVHSIGEELSKEGEKQESLFLIARGTVRIQQGGEDVDVVGTGQFLGEVAALTGRSSSATAIAESPVTALWLRPGDIKKAFRIAPAFKKGLWWVAGQRIGENLLREESPFNVISKKRLRRWLNEGTLYFREDGEDPRTSDQVVVLLHGSAHPKGSGSGELRAPAWFREQEASFSEDAVLLTCPVAELEKEEVPE
ncbi:MAG: cation:proton antiporter, partial [Flavobacteriales bacterium]